jgi:ElaB/YqjD/DUF883 family membrane-anchored ribosome-binding protein
MKVSESALRSLIHDEMVILDLRDTIREISRNEGELLGSVRNSTVYLFEGRQRTPKEISFGALLEQNRKGLITDQKILKIWESSTRYELDVLLSEGVMDFLRDAYEKAKEGVKSLGEKARAALEKASDFILEKSLQLMNLAQAGVEKAVKAAQGFIEAVQDFKSEHPVLFKIAVILAATIVVFAVMSFLNSPEAHAAVKMKGGKMMSQERYEAMRGHLSAFGDQGGFDAQEASMKAIQALDKAYKATDVQSITKAGGDLNGFIQASSKSVTDLVNDASGGDKVAYKLLMRFAKVGKSLKMSGG